MSILQQLNLDLAAIVARAGHSLVKVGQTHRQGAGAGTILHQDGLIITNAHVVSHGPVEVTLADERRLPAKVLAFDRSLDLAALSIEADYLAPIEIGDSKGLRPGQLVLALGHPWGVTGAVCAGPVINVGLPPELPQLGREFVQAGLQLRPGHSGGPMVDTEGRLIGLNTLITGPQVGLAVPAHVIKTFLRQQLGSPEPKPQPEMQFI